MAVQLDGVGNAGADEVIGIITAAAERKSGIGTINAADERGVGAETKSRVAGQPQIDEIERVSGSIDHSPAT